MDRDLALVLIGAGAAILGGIVGGWVQGLSWYYFEKRRAADENRKRWTQTALEWSKNGMKASLRRADLRKADLRGALLYMADVSFADLREADLEGTNLRGANLSNSH